jgi:hypothetical protein
MREMIMIRINIVKQRKLALANAENQFRMEWEKRQANTRAGVGAE